MTAFAAQVDAIRARYRLPSLSAGLQRADGSVETCVSGLADLEHAVAAQIRTRYRIGSISKTLTSAAVGLLVADGALDLDAPIEHYLPGYPAHGAQLTTRLLACHRSGIVGYSAEDELNRTVYPTALAALGKFKDRPLLFAPGERFHYSSFNWNLIAAVIEAVSGQGFVDFMDARVFAPLAMDDTCADRDTTIIDHRAGLYAFGEGGRWTRAPWVDNSDVYAAGGFLSTPADLIRFSNAIRDDRLFPAAIREELMRPEPRAPGEPDDQPYGLGWSHHHLLGRAFVGHRGTHFGGTAILLAEPDTPRTLVCACNIARYPAAANAEAGDFFAAVVADLAAAAAEAGWVKSLS